MSPRRILHILIVAAALATFAAHAQLRTFPPNAKRATVGQQQYPLPYIDLAGKQAKLSPGATIYDQDNRSIVHGALPRGADVVFTTDMHGDVARIYVLTPLERQQLDRRK